MLTSFRINQERRIKSKFTMPQFMKGDVIENS